MTRVFGYIIVGLLEEVMFFSCTLPLLILRKSDPSKELLEREIASIQELVEEEPNKKCMSDDLTMRPPC